MKIIGVLFQADDGTLWVQKSPEEQVKFSDVKIGDFALDLPIGEFELSTRTSNVLKNAEFKTLRPVAEMTEAEFLRVPNAGRKSLNEMREILGMRGLAFTKRKPEPDDGT